MEMSLNLVREYLDGWERQKARGRLDDALTAGFTRMGKDLQRKTLNRWALVSRGEAPNESTETVKRIKPDQIAAWVAQHGRRLG